MTLRRALIYPLLFVILAIFQACEADPVQTSKTNNNDVTVDLLFEHDGCRVFRFRDDGEFHYYVVCQKTDTQSTMTDYCTGKNCQKHIHESIQTFTEGYLVGKLETR